MQRSGFIFFLCTVLESTPPLSLSSETRSPHCASTQVSALPSETIEAETVKSKFDSSFLSFVSGCEISAVMKLVLMVLTGVLKLLCALLSDDLRHDGH